MSRINETLKQKIDELDLDGRLNDLVDQAEHGVRQALRTAGDLAHEHRDDVDDALDRLGRRFEDRTEGRYAEKVERWRRQLDLGLDRLEERRHEGPSDSSG